MRITYTLDTVIQFGMRHKGEILRHVIMEDVQYVDWLLAQGIIKLSPEAYEFYKKRFMEVSE